MRRLFSLLLASTLILVACGNDSDEKKEKNKNNETKKENKKLNSKEKDATKTSTNKNVDNNPVNVNEKSMQQINFNNITDRNTLKSVIYGNYNELDKLKAYNSAVANGVIPQGNVMEGPAIAAFESSLRVESGVEKSIYESSPEKRDYDNNGVYRTEQEQKAHERWVNGQVEWMNASEAEREEIRKRDAEKYGYEYNPDDYKE
ncbi:TPA: hypothetical protein PF400_000214 [Staphylococcus aureus]|uniref:hypothetical protein n=1 Tax=Staphylococcus aureus TaxID=1280 RepID=UPI0009754BAA|nr:hypothetical protein [Staphylococcus aureus]MDG6750604.1 hypothetical protein [Staphylococcus aureus]ONH16955.1 hypothetical protein BMF31_00810 [Staphylococcus aureus]ONH18608.1 hypothetical protein BMF23_11270 [Staphylococcus aureus]HDG5850865.1 hypothetical protein [Staphylococcus aureus]HDT6932173.1 hypothetical protein [Staphylococcus aureus]